MFMDVKTDCYYFKGDIPCSPHKKYGTHCLSCSHYQEKKQRILIIKLGAAGDVIRTTPILRKIRSEFPLADITWLTNYPVFVPKSFVNNIIKFNLENIIWLQSIDFDAIYNLDKDREAIGLTKILSAKNKKGFLPDEYGKCIPADENAKDKWLTGIFDDNMLRNRKSYPKEIFDISGYKFSGEKYILEMNDPSPKFDLPLNKKVIGLNTGCGTRWLTRLWGKENWIKLANRLSESGFYPLLLGGKTEDDLNREIENGSTAKYLGTFSLTDFTHLIDKCSLIVTSVTMAMHISIGLEKKIILLNNIFNKREFDLYGLGTILEPEKSCLGCYKNSCSLPCMSTISPDKVLQEIKKILE